MSLLKVYLNEDYVANLWVENKYYCFQYITGAKQPVSLSLPVRKEPYLHDYAKSYFANLLPEGNVRNLIEVKSGINRGDDFELLRRIGGDCAGAITLFPEDQIPFTNDSYTALSGEALIALIEALPQNPLCIGMNQRVRLSLPGAQNKTALFLKDGVYYVPENGAPSSHILKTPIANLSGIINTVQNETFVMMLAKEVGLNVPNVEMVDIGGTPVFVIERYDRYIDVNGKMQRILQEDFCQLTGLEPTMKYQSSGGPGLDECVNKIREHSSNSLSDIEQILKWTAFNIIIGNADAHAKNLSIIWGTEGIRLAPFYDVLSTTVYGKNHDDDFAMSIGRQYNIEKLNREDWKQLSDYLDISIKLIDRINSEIVHIIQTAKAKTVAVFEDKYGPNSTVTEIANNIDTRTQFLCNI